MPTSKTKELADEERERVVFADKLWGVEEGTAIKVQQDNASPHVPTDGQWFCAVVEEYGRRVELVFQPPNSPDLNVLDLGLFTAIQARQRLRMTRDLDELMAAVEASYWELPPVTINACFLTLQATMDKCIQEYGGNAFKPAHMAKARLEKEGRLPLSLSERVASPCSKRWSMGFDCIRGKSRSTHRVLKRQHCKTKEFKRAMPLVFSVRLQATTKPEPQSNEQEATNFLRWTVADFHTKNSARFEWPSQQDQQKSIMVASASSTSRPEERTTQPPRGVVAIVL
ncbi:hypothetical protein PI124_g11892 [Phytophthora idaei]|nr:hypothetical protein PI124_g11892 [Phytophthora idaei]